ncbi:alpha-adducin-like [Ostrinia furnacalis]|uniref:alpha-adducin-like n=1 Tax=Ostrinia furnacalis TaxID=93504 RepID=UPI00103DC158|nr:alpha-adducin-like [Ostrinia furnacalis]
MGAASKGIIQRGYQHNATVYSAPYARNPFDHVTDREIDEYRRVVERKQRGNEYDTDLSESEAISAAQITSPASAPSETEEESRDEHRVLRIETKQAPVRSQPEVVLSDDEFLNAERAHADRTKEVAQPDPNLLPDDEVFLSSGTASPAPVVVVRGPIRDDEVFLDSSVSSAPPPTKEVVVRSQQVAAVQRVVVRGREKGGEEMTGRGCCD